ncbi:hypothetical protein C0993_010579 [Termitomyces sp. T159_Od127]|nr:hypothetical protein C0993_010579 [Termitomyces sp. T159_Od127]
MPEEELRNACDVQEGTSRSVHHESQVSSVIDEVQKRTEACEKSVDETVNGLRSYDSFAKEIRDLGCSPDEAKDFFDAVRQRIDIREAKSKAPAIPTREVTPEGLSGEDLEAFRRERSDTISDLAREQERTHNQAVEAAAWAALRSKLDHVPSLLGHSRSLSQAIDLHKPLETSSIPQSLLDVAPHLAKLQSQVSADPHIAKTWELRQEYGKERIVDSLIDLGQLQRVKDPISRAMWKLVIMDHYVDFEKLYATLDKAYDHNDEPKDFLAGFSLVKKDHAVARRPILSGSDWSRTFDAWMAAVVVFYPIGKQSFRLTVDAFLIFSARFLEQRLSRSSLIEMHEIVTRESLFAWTTTTSFTFLCYPNCLARRLPHLGRISNATSHIKTKGGNVHPRYVKIGTWDFAILTHVPAIVGITCAANAVDDTGQEIIRSPQAAVQSKWNQSFELKRRVPQVQDPWATT